MFFDAFESIRILNLPHRSDRRSEMLAELRKFGLDKDPRLSFYPGSVAREKGSFETPGTHGCYMSHLALLKDAAAAGKRVLVLEDDCDFTVEARAYELPQDWDIFYGGYDADDPDDLLNSNVIGAHCMGYSPRAVKMLADYLEALLDPDFPPDPVALARGHYSPGVKPPFDGAIVWFRRAHPELKTVFAQIAIQRSSRSDIAGGNFLDRNIPFAAVAARKAKNWVRRRFS
jgi:glycosyl transferase family 25